MILAAANRGRRPPAKVEKGHLVSLCWCERAYVSLPRPVVIAGRTESCGHPECQAPA